MNHKYIFDVIKDLYIFELEAKDRINNKVTIPIGIVTLLIGALFFLSKNLSDIKMNSLGILFFIFFAASTVSIIVIIIFIVLSYYNYKYRTLPYEKKLDLESKEVAQYYELNYEEYFSKNGISKEDLIKESIKKRLYNHYLKATESNRNLNNKKNKYLRYSGYTIVIALILLSGSFIFHQLSFNEKPTEIKLINNKEVK